MFYEALKSRGGRRERGRKSMDRSILVIKYVGTRPREYLGYKPLFKGDPYEFMKWLHARQGEFGVKLDYPKPKHVVVRDRRPTLPKAEPPKLGPIPVPVKPLDVVPPPPDASSRRIWLLAAVMLALGLLYYFFG